MKNFTTFRHIIASLLFFCLSTASLIAAGWSYPPITIFPSNSYGPTIVTDPVSGNSVAVWYNIVTDQGTGTLQAATLTSDAVNAIGQPHWVLTTFIASDVLASFPIGAAAGIDNNGKTTVTWADNNNNVFVSSLASGGSIWSSPVTINTPIPNEIVAPSSIAVAPNGNIIVIWTSSPSSYHFNLLANVFDAQTQTWRGQQTVVAGILHADSPINPVVVDAVGNGLAVFGFSSLGIRAFSYNFSTDIWTTITPLQPSTHFSVIGAAMDPAGDASVLAFDENHEAIGAILPFGQTSFTNVQTLSTTITDTLDFATIQMDSQGNALAVWPEISNALGSARYSSTTQQWTVLPLLRLGFIPFLSSLALDVSGNAVAAWTLYNGVNAVIQSATLKVNDTSWQQLSTLTPLTDEDILVKVVLTSKGDALAVWEDIVSTIITGSINSSIYLEVFSTPAAATNFTGKVRSNEFLTQTDRIHTLMWNASPSPEVANYQLYRNGALIATIPADSSSYVYNDHNRNKKVPDTYKLVAVSGLGMQSTPLFVTLQ